jgi:beta-mannosidase
MFSRFSAEQSAFGLPFVSSLRKFMTDEDIYGDDQYISEFHMKNNPDLGLTLFEYVNMMSQKIFGDYTSGADRVLKQQMVHCEWMRVTLEAHRTHKWFSSGVIYWMYNDCWAAANGWSIVDYYVKPKPGYYAFKRAAQPVIAAIEKRKDDLCVFCCNDSLEAVNGKAKLYLYDFKADKNVWEADFDFCTEENSTSKAYSVCYADVEKLMTSTTILICDAETNLGSDRAFFVAKRFCDLEIEYTDVEVISRTDNEITVKAKTFTPFVMLDEEKLLEDNCFMLKAGETRTVKFVK